jgi:hypothetical protein
LPPKTKDAAEEQKQQKIEVSLATPEETEALRAKYLEAMATGPPKIISAGFDIRLEALACALEGDEIRCAIRAEGKLIRPGMVYEVTSELNQLTLSDGGKSELIVKAKVKKKHVESA